MFKKYFEFCLPILIYHFVDHVGGSIQIIVHLSVLSSMPWGKFICNGIGVYNIFTKKSDTNDFVCWCDEEKQREGASIQEGGDW